MRRTILGFATLVTLPACSGDDGPDGTNDTPPATQTSITSATVPTNATEGETESTPTTGEPTDGGTTAGGCGDDAECEEGSVCVDGACVPGCSDTQPCTDGLACCDGQCVDLLADPLHCGTCDACPGISNAEPACDDGTCVLGPCADGFVDCDQSQANGCEIEGICSCTPGEMVACYTGTPGTEGQGACVGGMQTCNADGDGYGPCEGEVKPVAEVCGNTVDDDCNGTVDDDPDADGDGFTLCSGDCCDTAGPNCSNPELVNPGSFEVPDNQVDDDCNNTIDDSVSACDDALTSNSGDPIDYAKAIDLCQVATEDGKTWGVISGAFNRSNGSGDPSVNARSIRQGFGNMLTVQANTSLAVLSTGNAADPGDSMPGHIAWQGGTNLNTPAAVPADWLAANGNNLPNVGGCPEPQGGSTGFDTIQFKLRVRVPTNALSFSTKVYFFSSEYPEWVCSPYNDFFVALVDSTSMGNPADKNIAIYKNPQDQLFPLGVNILKGAPGLFTQCRNGQVGCGGGAVLGSYDGCVGYADLLGTGFEVQNPPPQFANDPGWCSTNNQTGGGTGWLNMAGNVTPGEVMELRFVLWDTGDNWYDSVVLLDDFQWSVQASEPGISPG
jgi:hypothetical protein